MNALHYNHWKQEDKLRLESTRTFKDLAELAMSIVDRIPLGIEMVSGPISTGGVGSLEGNRKVFERVIETLVSDHKINIFSQMPFEDKMVEFYRVWHANNRKEKYCMPILDDFYEPLFSSGKVVTLHFIHDWQSSFGAKWEHERCISLGIRIVYLKKGFHK